MRQRKDNDAQVKTEANVKNERGNLPSTLTHEYSLRTELHGVGLKLEGVARTLIRYREMAQQYTEGSSFIIVNGIADSINKIRKIEAQLDEIRTDIRRQEEREIDEIMKRTAEEN